MKGSDAPRPLAWLLAAVFLLIPATGAAPAPKGNPGTPAWIPTYPGAGEIRDVHREQNSDGVTGGFGYYTKAPSGVVSVFYQRALEGAGFKVDASGEVVSAEDPGNKRTVRVVIGRPDDEGTPVSITYAERN